jgi:transposase
MTPHTRRVDLDMKELEAILEQARAGSLDEDGYRKLKAALQALGYLTDLIGDKDTTIARLRKIVFGPSTEKTSTVLETGAGAVSSSKDKEAEPEKRAGAQAKDNKREEDNKRKGHGRNGAESFTGAERVKVTHESLRAGDCCPECLKGKVYGQKVPALIVRIVGRAPLGATVYELEKLRCNLCGEMFTAAPPEGIGKEKYDETAAGMIALLKYGSGFPFHRLERLQESMGIPLPASTQWGKVREVAGMVEPVYEELIRQAAQGEVLYNDDTAMRILELMKSRPKTGLTAPEEDDKGRTGIFTSGIVSTRDGREMALFFTGTQYAGENLGDVLKKRAQELGPPIHMCDGLLSRNLPKEFETILANCTAHARRGFVDLASRFPEECRYVLETFRDVYRNDALAKERGLSPEERLAFHQAETGPMMEKFESWLKEQIAEKKVEPNSGLGQAISYVKNHWRPLTLFLRVPGAPLDNNVCERALKKAILHRKGSLFYKTQNGAHVGDLFMSLIHTCQLCKMDPFDYLVELQRHSEELARSPQDWMPWNYRETLTRASRPRAPN